MNIKNTKIYEETIYTDNLYKQIKFILGNPKNFIKSRKEVKEKISYRLKELSLFTEYSDFFKSESVINLKEFEDEKKEFIKSYNHFMSSKIKRSDSSELVNQIRLSVKKIIQYSEKNGYINGTFTTSAVIDKLNPEKIFSILLKTAISSISFTDINNNDIKHNDIVRNVFINNFTKHFVLYLFYLLLENNPQASSLLCVIYQEIPNILNDYQEGSHTQYFTKSSFQLIIIFNKVFGIQNKTVNFNDDSNKYKTVIFLTLPSKICEFTIPPTHLPEITQPTNTYENLDDIINFSKGVKNGFSTAELSESTKNALKISHKKVFKINKNSLTLFKKLDELPYEKTKKLDLLPFTPLSNLIYLENRINYIESNIKPDTMKKIADYYSNKVLGTFITNLDDQIISDLNISLEEYQLSQELYKLKKEYKEKVKLRILHNTVIKMAEIFEGFPIFYINSYDFRLRMYPWNYMFNRTSGIYKYILEESRRTVSLNGLKVMIKAYFKDNLEKIKLFENLISKEEIINLFNKIENLDSIEKTNKDSFFYRTLLGYEIKNLLSNKFSSGFMIEIDQKSSASVILSIVFGDEVLARESNLSSDPEIKDINNFIMEKAGQWFKGKVGDHSLKIISSSRKMHKYLFMCFIYNETSWGRRERIREYISDEYDQDRSIVTNKYPDFLNSIFPSIFTKRDLFNDIIKYYIKSSNKKIVVETLDGSLISWFIFKKGDSENVKIKLLDPIAKEIISHHYQSFNRNEVNLRKTILGMMPNFIHSIDGAIMRLIIIDVNERINYIINHLHDSIQFHPNYYNEIKKSIEDVYTSDKLENILERRLFTQLRQNLLEEKRSDFDALVKKFYDSEYKNISVKKGFNVENMFPFE